MRIDKKNNAIYIKELDEMEKYFLNMFKRFIEHDDGFLDESVESIITEAVKRAKKEIIFETTAGVLSVNNMSGVVKLTLDDLGGEPKILVKYSAFNRPFGLKANTVCEGDDERLSDARVPLAHNHNDLYYLKSETATHTQDGYMDRLDKIKLDKIEENANNYIHPSGSGYNHIPAGGSIGQYLAWCKDGEAEWANFVLNKATTITDGIMSKEDKIKLDGIEANVKTYVHPASSGYKHVPVGGNKGEVLGWKSDGEAEWESKVTGNDGQVYYISGNSSSDIKPAYIFYKANIIETDKELQDAKATLIDPSVIYDTWYRFSHDNSENQPAIASEITGWTYDSANKKILCQTNSASYVGFVSPEKYDSYNLEVTLTSNDGDNDAIGIVIAFTKDSSGREYTLSVVRTRSDDSHIWFENTAHQYAIVYNYNRSDEKLITHASISSDTMGGWMDIPNGIRLKVVRDRDKITTYSSEMNSTTISPYNKIELDLNSNALLAKFKGACQYGYSCLSQMYSGFSDIQFDKDNKYIYDSRTNKTWVVDVAGNWSIDLTKKISSEIGIGKFVFNETTKKLYYINDRDNILSLSYNGLSGSDKAKLDSIEYNANNYVHPAASGYTHIPAGGSANQVLEWKADGEAEWSSLDKNTVTFESSKVKKRGTVTISLAAGIYTSHSDIDISIINFYNAPTYRAYYINDDGTKEQIPTIIFNSLDVSEVIKAYINTTTFKVNVTRKDATLSKDYKIYFEILDIDNSVTIEREKSIKVLNIYPGEVGATYTFTNWKGEISTLPMTAQVKRWMEEPNDESPKGYGQGLINVNCVNIDDFNSNPYVYLKDSSGNWIYDTVYLGAWDSNNGKVYSDAAVNAIKSSISAGKGYIGGHDTLGHLPGSINTLEDTVGIIDYTSTWCSNSVIEVSKSGFVSSFPWNLGDLNTKLNVPISHVTNQFYTGDVWFKYVPNSGFVETNTVNGKTGTNNFYLGTFKNTAFIQTGHSNGAASPDEQKILANVFYYLAGRGI